MSKRIISVLLSVLLVVLMFGCSNSPAAEPVATDAQATDAAVQSETAEATAAPSTESRGTLTIMVGSADAGATALKAMLDKAAEIMNVEVITSVFPEDQFLNVARTKIATGNGDDLIIDSWSLPDSPYQSYVALDGPWVEKVSDATKPFIVSPDDGTTVLMAPFGAEGNFGFAYNKAVLEKAGVQLPITNYADFTAACEKIKAIGVTPVYVSNGENWTAQILLLASMTSTFMNDKTLVDQLITNQIKPTDVSSLVSLWDNVRNLMVAGYINEDFMSATHAMGKQAIAEGTCAFYCVTDGAYGEINTEYPDLIDGVGYTLVPMWNDSSDAFVMQNRSNRCISVISTSKNIELAKEFVNVCLTEPVLTAYYEQKPGPSPFVNVDFELPQSPWNAELAELTKSGTKVYGDWANALYDGVAKLNPFWGDFNLQIQSLFAGKTTEEALNAWYAKYADDAKAKRVAEFE